MSVIKISNESFDKVLSSDKRVLIDFYADWCGPCRMVSPIVDAIAEEHPEYLICKVNVDEESELSEKFGVFSIPTLVVLDKGAGARPKEAILDLLRK